MRDAIRPVLIVDDDEDFRETLRALLEWKGYPVATAQSGRSALRAMRNGTRPSVVITDLMMPEMDGWQFRREMLKRRHLAGVPVIVLSATDAGEWAPRFAAFLKKPVAAGELCSLLDRHCRPDHAEDRE